MPYAAITYQLKPGHEEEVAELFAGFKRVDTPVMQGEDGKEVGRLLGTAVFIRDDFMVRFIHYEGDFAAISQHMARQQGMHSIEAGLVPFLVEQRDTSTPEAFGQHFSRATMRCISQLSLADYPQG
jgi:hypothetical protein